MVVVVQRQLRQPYGASKSIERKGHLQIQSPKGILLDYNRSLRAILLSNRFSEWQSRVIELTDVKMKSFVFPATFLSFLAIANAANSTSTAPLSSCIILPDTFKPPQVFKNINLLRNVNLEKGYIKESVNVVIENTDAKPQNEYYIPFPADVIGKVGGLEVRDKKDISKPKFRTEVVEYDPYRYIKFPFSPLPSGD